MKFFINNRFNIIIIIAISVLLSWSFYIINTQVGEKEKLENLDVRIKHYSYVGEIIHAIQIERKASVLYSLKLSGITKTSLQSFYNNSDEKIYKCTAYMKQNNLDASDKTKVAQLEAFRAQLETTGCLEVCSMYTSLIRLFMNELIAIYKSPLPAEIKSELLKYIIMANIHESMVQVDQAASVAILNKRFLDKKHVRFFNNALFKAESRRNDYLLLAKVEETEQLSDKYTSSSHKSLHETTTKLLSFKPEDTIEMNILDWDNDFNTLNWMQEDLEFKFLRNIEKLTQKHIEIVNSKIYLYFLLNSIVLLIILGSFLFIKRLYGGLLKHKSDLDTYIKAVENSDNNIIITDLDHKIIYVNEAFEKMTGYSREEIIGKTPSILQSGKHNQAYYDEITNTISSGKKWLGEFINKKKDGTLFYEKASITPMINEKGEIEGYISLKLDMTNERKSQKIIQSKNTEIEYQLYHDSLTDLSNRNQFLIDLKKSVCPMIILTNINDFKQVNTYYGIHIGDEILKQLSLIFKSIAKAYELKVYRMYSDEFALLCDREMSQSQIYDILFLIKTRVSEFKFGPEELQLLLYVSIGISVCDKNSPDASTLQLEDADIALKFAKNSNNYYAFYNDAKSLVKTFENNLVWTKKISEAINKEQIVPHFQPIVDAEGKIVLYEALVRMFDNGNIVYPGTFLDISKHAKLYPQITRIMVEKVFKVFEHREESVSINISYEDVADERTVKHILDLIDRYKMAERLTFEILESESIENYDLISTFITRVKSKGCKVSIDDFGSGYSNFERILKLDIDYIKIDGSIIRSINDDENSRTVTEIIVNFAKKSGFKLVAEFVCDKAVNDTVMELGIDYRQGFYLGKPQELL